MFTVYNSQNVPCYTTDDEALAEMLAFLEDGYYAKTAFGN